MVSTPSSSQYPQCGSRTPPSPLCTPASPWLWAPLPAPLGFPRVHKGRSAPPTAVALKRALLKSLPVFTMILPVGSGRPRGPARAPPASTSSRWALGAGSWVVLPTWRRRAALWRFSPCHLKCLGLRRPSGGGIYRALRVLCQLVFFPVLSCIVALVFALKGTILSVPRLSWIPERGN